MSEPAADAPAAAIPAAEPAQIQAQALSLINAERSKHNLRPLTLSEPLCLAALEHAVDMDQHGYFHFKGSGDGGDLDARIARAGYRGRTGAELNRGRLSVEEAVASWLDNESTRGGLLAADYCHLGVGMSGGYWTLILGAPTLDITAEMRERVRDLINRERAPSGAPPLQLLPALVYDAQVSSLRAARSGTAVSDDSLAGDVPSSGGYQGQRQELLARDLDTPDAVVAHLMAAAAARPQLLLAEARDLGVGMSAGVWTLLVGVPATAAVNSSAELSAAVLQMLNGHRESARLPPLSLHEALSQAADSHAADMVKYDFFDFAHRKSPGVVSHVQRSGYRGRTLPAITMGQTTPEAVVQLLLGNAGHRRNFLDAQFRDLGVGVQKSRWTLLLGAPAAEASADLCAELLRLINNQRAAGAAPPLTMVPSLWAAAQAFANDMVKRNYFGFTNPDGLGTDALARRNGFTGRTVPAIVKGYNTPEAALDTWMKSPQNRLNLLDPQFQQIGIGVAESRWVLILGAPDSVDYSAGVTSRV